MFSTHNFLIVLLIALCLLAWTPRVAAFGAGNIYAFLEGIAARHGDIEDVLSELFKKGGSTGISLLGLGGSKFGGLDIKRDYSQAMDVAGLSKLSRQQILNLVMALTFLAMGYATGGALFSAMHASGKIEAYLSAEFEVTEERLGVYLPVEHIDNPKDYNDNKDARQVHPGLRPPVQQIELEVDPRTGMKNYIANEQGHWDTSSACVRRSLVKCIDFGRRARSSGREEDLYEAYRLLGTFLHTLEDLPAHSNYCELMLQRLGHRQVFAHVGDGVRIRAPNGEMHEYDGSKGSSDFMHSLLGEAGDHISEASVSDLNKTMEKARSAPASGTDGLRDMFMQIPGGGGGGLSRDMDSISNMNRGPGAKNPADMSPQELHAALWQVLTFRDNVVKTIERTIEKIPGLGSLIDKIMDSINKFVFTTLEPYLKPIMSQATGALHAGSAQVINNQDQYAVFDQPHASDPTHSLLAKDHFGVILNEPAGELAKIILRHTVKAVVAAWDDTSINPNQVAQGVLSAIHHPYFTDGSPVQRDMASYMEKWINNHRDRDYVLRALTKEEVRAGRNKRKGHKDPPAQGSYQSFLPPPSQLAQQVGSHIPGYSAVQGLMNNRDMPGGGMPEPVRDMGQPSYGGHGSYGNEPQSNYGGGHSHSSNNYSAPPPLNYGSSGGYQSHQQPSYRHQQTSYQQQQPAYGGSGGFPEPSYGGHDQGGHGQQSSYGGAGGFPEPHHSGGGHYGGPPRHGGYDDQPGFPQPQHGQHHQGGHGQHQSGYGDQQGGYGGQQGGYGGQQSGYGDRY